MVTCRIIRTHGIQEPELRQIMSPRCASLNPDIAVNLLDVIHRLNSCSLRQAYKMLLAMIIARDLFSHL